MSTEKDMKETKEPKEAEKVRQPQQQRSLEKKQRIVDAAVRLFTEKGYYNTNTKEIAKEADVATGTLYSYYADKREIFMDVMRIYKERFNQIVENGVLQLTPDPAADRRELMMNILNLILETHHIFDFLIPDMQTLSHGDAEVRCIMSENHEYGIGMSRRFLEIWSDQVRIQDKEAGATILYSTIRRSLDLIAHEETPIEAERLLNELADMLLLYIFGDMH